MLFVSLTVEGGEFKWYQLYQPLGENQINVHRGCERNLHFYFDGKNVNSKISIE